MIKKYLLCTLIMTSLAFIMTACGGEGKKETLPDAGEIITIVEEKNQEETKPEISVDKTDRFEKVTITDWLDEDTVIVAKENESLGKLSLAELSDQYPTSLYLLDINTKEYQLLMEQEEVLLGEATLSKDKKFLLYQKYDLGDPTFFVMNRDTKESFGIMGEPIGGAISAKWSDKDTVIGAAYSGGAYLADTTGEIMLVEELKEEAIFLVEKINNDIYYNTTLESTLMRLNLTTKEKVSLNLEQVYDTIPSFDGKQMLILQANGSKASMLVYDLESGEETVLVEGSELHSASWSPDQRRIAYSMKANEDNTSIISLYVYDMLTRGSTQIAVSTDILATNWSPSGEKLSYTEWNGTQATSNIIYLK